MYLNLYQDTSLPGHFLGAQDYLAASSAYFSPCHL